MVGAMVTDTMSTVESAVLTGADAMLRCGGFCPEPQVHFFIDESEHAYLGYVRTRPYRAGADAVEAIVTLGSAAGATTASSVLVAWDAEDLRIALNEPQQHRTGIVCVTAWIDRYEVHLYPYTLHIDAPPTSPEELPVTHAEWGCPINAGEVTLPPVIEHLLYEWRTTAPDAEPLFLQLQQNGYRVVFMPR